MVVHSGHSKLIQDKIPIVLNLLAQDYPQHFHNNFPGLTHIPFVPGQVRSLPMLMQTQFNHEQWGPVTAYAVMLYTDTPLPDGVADHRRGWNFERFFVHMEETSDAEYTGLDSSSECFEEQQDSNAPNQPAVGKRDCCAPRTTLHRSLNLHEIVAVEPSHTPLSQLVGQHFSSFQSSLRCLGSSESGWLGWRCVAFACHS